MSKELWQNIFENDLSEELEDLLTSGRKEDPNQRLTMTSPLAAAAHFGALECVKVLLNHGADVNFGGRSGHVPLYVAVKGKQRVHTDIMDLLIKSGAKLDIVLATGNTPLLEAVTHKESETTNYSYERFTKLLKAGASVNVMNNAGDSCLHLAASRGRVSIVEKLLASGMDASLSQKRGMRTKVVTGITPLHLAATVPTTVFDNAHVARVLIQAGADVDARKHDGPTPLLFAAYYGAETVADILLTEGCQVDPLCVEESDDSIWSTPLSVAVHRDDVAMVTRLLAAGADVERGVPPSWSAPLVTAALTGKVRTCRALIRAGCDCGATCPGGASVLHALLTAVTSSSASSASSASAAGADLEKLRIAGMLVRAGAAVGAAEEAAIREVMEMLQRYLVSAAESDTTTALRTAEEELRILLTHGKSPSLKQLARLCIVKRLKANNHRPDVIYTVLLPPGLQDYVAFCDI